MRLGIGSSARHSNTSHHPVHTIQQYCNTIQYQKQQQLQSYMYGTTEPIKQRLELQMVQSTGRLPLPGTKSSNFAAEILLGLDDDITMSDYMNNDITDDLVNKNLHEHMELQMGDKPYKKILGA